MGQQSRVTEYFYERKGNDTKFSYFLNDCEDLETVRFEASVLEDIVKEDGMSDYHIGDETIKGNSWDYLMEHHQEVSEIAFLEYIKDLGYERN